jgi:hypothetical protein
LTQAAGLAGDGREQHWGDEEKGKWRGRTWVVYGGSQLPFIAAKCEEESGYEEEIRCRHRRPFKATISVAALMDTEQRIC